MLDQMNKNAKIFFIAIIFSLIVGAVVYVLMTAGIEVNPVVLILVIMFLFLIAKPVVNTIKGDKKNNGE